MHTVASLKTCFELNYILTSSAPVGVQTQTPSSKRTQHLIFGAVGVDKVGVRSRNDPEPGRTLMKEIFYFFKRLEVISQMTDTKY